MVELLLAKFLFVIACFTYASHTDLKKREVSNKLWLFMLPVIVLFALLDFQPLILLHSAFLGVVIGYIGFYHLAKFGGADAKAVMVLSVCFPTFILNLPVFIYILLYSLMLATLYSLWKWEFKKPLAFMPFLTLGTIAFLPTCVFFVVFL